ncbi:hypothetical protein C8R43DRAFT_960836 [Mycena crocata]|nr:hypothetical protein C8R43DRAFT_960836 [Mycena crocata]
MKYLQALFLTALCCFVSASPFDAFPGDAVPVPGRGLQPKSQVYLIPEGGQVVTVGDEVHLLDASGKVLHVSPSRGTHNISRRGDAAPGWITTAVWYGSAANVPITSYTSTWKVPLTPETDHDQLLYYFNALACPNLLLQPVLRYWVDGWTVASWFLTPTANYVTTSVAVQVGQVLTGAMTQVKHNTTSYSVTSAFTGIAATLLNGTASEPVYDAYASALEQYSTKTNSLDYPAGTMRIDKITLKFAGTAPAITYGVNNYQPDIGTTTITTNGITGAKTVVHHPTPFKLMTFCTHANFSGSCDTVTYPSAATVPAASAALQCINLEAPYLSSISSAKILPTTGYACYLYRNANCATPRLRIDKSYTNLANNAFNDIALSWSCSKV